MQTNGTLITDKWCDFLKRNNFMVRINLDGPKEIHNPYRKDRQGGCPKHRFATTCQNEPGLHYLCEGHKKFFQHIRKHCRAAPQLLEHGLPASRIMEATKGPLVITR